MATPDVLGVGPQMTMVMSPNSDPTAAFVTFYLNYRDYPDWQPGGLQLKAYGAAFDPSSPPPLLDTDTEGTQVCSTAGETISWTQRMSLSSGSLNLSVVNGSVHDLGQLRPEPRLAGRELSRARSPTSACTSPPTRCPNRERAGNRTE